MATQSATGAPEIAFWYFHAHRNTVEIACKSQADITTPWDGFLPRESWPHRLGSVEWKDLISQTSSPPNGYLVGDGQQCETMRLGFHSHGNWDKTVHKTFHSSEFASAWMSEDGNVVMVSKMPQPLHEGGSHKVFLMVTPGCGTTIDNFLYVDDNNKVTLKAGNQVSHVHDCIEARRLAARRWVPPAPGSHNKNPEPYG